MFNATLFPGSLSLSLFPVAPGEEKKGDLRPKKRRLVFFFFNEPIKPETVKLGQRFSSDTKWRKINGLSIL